MSNYGSNSFVIEGSNGAEIYEKIMKAFNLCVKLNTEYEIGKVNGKVYKISKSKPGYSGGFEYHFSVHDEDNKYPAWSIIGRKYVKLIDGNLHISESWINSVGTMEYYIRDVKLHKQTNVYFETHCEADMVGATNDGDGKYFEKCCVLLDYDSEAVGDEIPDNYDELPFEEQLSICKSLEEKGVDICYGIPKIIETEKFLGGND